MEKKKEFHAKVHLLLLTVIAFCLPVSPPKAPLFIVLLLLNWIVEGDLKNKFSLVLKNKFAVIFISLFLLHLVGLTYTENMSSGLFDVQVKLSLIIFPLILASRPVEKKETDRIFYGLIAGGCVSALIMLSRATYVYLTTGENNYTYEAFSSFLIHPSYISMYLNVANAWILIGLMTGKFTGKKFSNLVASVVLLFFSFIIVLLSSKMGLLTMVILYAGFLVYFVISRKKYLFGLAGMAAIIIGFLAMLHFAPDLKIRLTTAISALTNKNTNEAEAESTAVRMLVWKAANQVISEHPVIGTGTGDAKDELMKEYEKRGMTGAIEHKLNAHNEFYQVFVALGLLGFVVLLISIFLPLIFAYRSGNTIYILFLFIIILNFLTEAMFEKQAGVMFYAFMNSLLCFSFTNSKTEKL
jgi:O-antigen ligase